MGKSTPTIARSKRQTRRRVLVRSIGLEMFSSDRRAGQRFAGAFKEVWSRIPFLDRRDPCADWRQNGVPSVTIQQTLEEDDEAAGTCSYSDIGDLVEMKVRLSAVVDMTDCALTGLIAHELAHALVGSPLQVEGQANQIVCGWGLWPELDALMVETWNKNDLPKRSASRRRMLLDDCR